MNLSRLTTFLLPLLLVAGCASVRAGDPAQRPDAVQPVRHGAMPAYAPAEYFSTQTEGLAAVVRDLDWLSDLVGIVSRMPHEPGEYVVDFSLIQADLAAMRAGLIEAIRKPTTAPRVYPPLSADYVR